MKGRVTHGITQFLLLVNIEKESLKQRPKNCVGGTNDVDWMLIGQ